MNPGMKFRVIALGVAMIVLGGLIALVTMKVVQQHASQLQTRLNQLDAESFDILEQFRETYREENDQITSLPNGPLRYQFWNEFPWAQGSSWNDGFMFRRINWAHNQKKEQCKQ